MTLNVPAQAAQIALRFLLAGDTEEMIVTIGVTTPGTGQIVADAVANEAASAFLAAFPANTFSTAYTFVGTTARMGNEGAVADVASNVVGTAVQNNLPNNCAFLVRKNTGVGGRRNRGRMFFPPMFLTESDIGPTGVIDAPDVATLQTKFTAFLTDLEAGVQVDNVVLFHNSPELQPLAPTLITSLALQSKIATQRRRMRP